MSALGGWHIVDVKISCNWPSLLMKAKVCQSCRRKGEALDALVLLSLGRLGLLSSALLSAFGHFKFPGFLLHPPTKQFNLNLIALRPFCLFCCPFSLKRFRLFVLITC